MQLTQDKKNLRDKNFSPKGTGGDVGENFLLAKISGLSFFLYFWSSLGQILLNCVLHLQENGFEFDLAPFLCRKVAVSFAFADFFGGIVSNYSSSVIMDVLKGSYSYFTDSYTVHATRGGQK